MATTLDVVNDCLATLGETPLNTLNEPHEFKASAQRYLAKALRRIQAPGWWCNTENFSATPNSVTGQIQLAGDVIKWQAGIRDDRTGIITPTCPWIVQRGSRLYDTRERSYIIDVPVQGSIVREVPFEDLPHQLNDLVAAEAVLRFQSHFDGDRTKREELQAAWAQARSVANSENIRQQRINVLDNNPRLQRIKSRVRALRGRTY